MFDSVAGRLASSAALARKASRLAVGVARHPIMYPALRARPTAHTDALGALSDLGFDRSQADEFDTEYRSTAPALYRGQLERMTGTGAPQELLDKLRDPTAPQLESNRLVYLAVRLLRPETVVETGTFAGLLSTFVLKALEDNGRGRLLSLDLPAYYPIARAIDFAIPVGEQPGWAIADGLRARLEIVLGDARQTLPRVLEQHAPIGVFIHDSLQTTRHMLFEYRSAWRSLTPGGALFSNNAFVTPAFWWFTRAKGAPFRFVGGDFGVTRKPLT
jgi:predicted O-methyltransferase YrrM